MRPISNPNSPKLKTITAKGVQGTKVDKSLFSQKEAKPEDLPDKDEADTNYLRFRREMRDNRSSTYSNMTDIVTVPRSGSHKEPSHTTGRLVPKDLFDKTPKLTKVVGGVRRGKRRKPKGINQFYCGGEHPLDSMDYFSKLSFGWVNPFLKRRERVIKEYDGGWEACNHFKLPNSDKIMINFNRMLGGLSEQKGSQKFIGEAILTAFGWKIVQLIHLVAVSTFFLVSSVFIFRSILEHFEALETGKGKKSEHLIPLLAKLASFYVWFFLYSLTSKFVSFEANRLDLKIYSSILMLSYDKMLKKNTKNKSTFSEKIVEKYFIETLNRVRDLFKTVFELTQLAITFISGIVLVWLHLGVAVLGIFLAQIFSALILYTIINVDGGYRVSLERKTQMRRSLTKNGIKGLRSIKQRALEKFYHMKLYQARFEEIKQLRKPLLLNGLFIFLTNMSVYFNLLMPLIALSLLQEPEFGIEDVSVLLLIFEFFLRKIFYFNFYKKVKKARKMFVVDFEVINTFLNSNNIDKASWVHFTSYGPASPLRKPTGFGVVNWNSKRKKKGKRLNSDLKKRKPSLGGISANLGDGGYSLVEESHSYDESYGLVMESGYFEWNKQLDYEEQQKEKKVKKEIQVLKRAQKINSMRRRERIMKRFKGSHGSQNEDLLNSRLRNATGLLTVKSKSTVVTPQSDQQQLENLSPEQRQKQLQQQLIQRLLTNPGTEPEVSAKEAKELNKKKRMLLSLQRKKISFRLKDISFRVPKGKLAFVIGGPKSGKTSLLYALLGEMRVSNYRKKMMGSQSNFLEEEEYEPSIKNSVIRGYDEGGRKPRLVLNGSVAFYAHTPWILKSKSLEENIVLDEDFDSGKLRKWMKVVNLGSGALPNLKKMGRFSDKIDDQNRTKIGLARCFYQESSIYIFDDFLSKMKSWNERKQVFEQGVMSLEGKTRVIATQSVEYLDQADVIYIMERGRIIFKGSYNDVKNHNIYKELKYKEEKQDYLKKKSGLVQNNFSLATPKADFDSFDDNDEHSDLVKKIKRDAVGDSEVPSVHQTLQVANSTKNMARGFLLILLATLQSLAYLVTIYGVLKWSRHQSKQVDFSQKLLLAISLSLVVISMLQGYQIILSFVISLRVCFSLFINMTFRYFHCQLQEFFELVTADEIMQRFSHDVDKIDTSLAFNVSNFAKHGLDIFANLVVISWALGNPFVLVVIIPSFYILTTMQKYAFGLFYENYCLSQKNNFALQTWCLSTLHHNSEIRMFEKQLWTKNFVRKFLVENSQNSILKEGLKASIYVKISAITILFVDIPVILALMFTYRGQRAPHSSYQILAVICSLMMIKAIHKLLTELNVAFSTLVSIRRCQEIAMIEPEVRYLDFTYQEKKSVKPKEVNLPKVLLTAKQAIIPKGKIDFLDVTCKPLYQPTCLSRASFKVKPGEKVGVISTSMEPCIPELVDLLWRAREATKGNIMIDRKHINARDVKEFRREVCVVNRNEIGFLGNLRENISTNLEYIFKHKKNKKVFYKQESLALQCLKEFGFPVYKLSGQGLDWHVDENGQNMSKEERQIVGLVRAVITKKKLVILDRATESLTEKIEARLFRVMAKELKASTILYCTESISILERCDRVLVFQGGRLVESGTHQQLIAKTRGAYRGILVRRRYLGSSMTSLPA